MNSLPRALCALQQTQKIIEMREKYDCQIGICCRKAIKQRTLCQNNVFLDCHPVSRYFQVWRDRTFFSNDTMKREKKKTKWKKKDRKVIGFQTINQTTLMKIYNWFIFEHHKYSLSLLNYFQTPKWSSRPIHLIIGIFLSKCKKWIYAQKYFAILFTFFSIQVVKICRKMFM